LQQGLLELLYEREFKKIKFFPRKLSLYDSSKILLCGPRGSGKTMLLHDYLADEAFGSYLYIDFYDFRVKGISKEELESFIETKKITTLVLDNFDFSFSPPNTLKTIITSSKIAHLDGFTTKFLYPLDFEEFLSFEKRFLSEQISFNNFSLIGTFPFVAVRGRDFYEHSFRLFLNSIFDDETKFFIFKKLSLKQGSTITLLSLYNEIKQEIKISKDKFYQVIKDFEESMLIFFLSKYQKNSHYKKIYMIDFAIRGIISYEKDFNKRLENMIFTELLKRGEKLHYHDNFDFILKEKSSAIVSIPFLPEGLLKNKLKFLTHHAKKLNIFNVKVITLDPQFTFENNGVKFEVVSFWSFAIDE